MASKSLSNIVYCNPNVGAGIATPLCPNCKIYMALGCGSGMSLKRTKIMSLDKKLTKYCMYECLKCHICAIGCQRCNYDKDEDSHNRYENLFLVVDIHEGIDESNQKCTKINYNYPKQYFYHPIPGQRATAHILPCDICVKK